MRDSEAEVTEVGRNCKKWQAKKKNKEESEKKKTYEHFIPLPSILS